MEREGAKKNVLTFIHVRVFSCDYECNATRVIISRVVNDNQHFRILCPYVDLSRYEIQDSRKRKICNRLEEKAIHNFSIFNFSYYSKYSSPE